MEVARYGEDEVWNVSKTLCYHVKRWAINNFISGWTEEFAQLCDYIDVLK